MYPPRTPNKAHDYLNGIIKSLSAKWSLNLPIRETPWSPSRIENPDDAGEKILSRMRFLYFKDRKALDGVIYSFEDWARPVISDWKWKPRQEPGTIPTAPKGVNASHRNSFIKTTDIPQSAIRHP